MTFRSVAGRLLLMGSAGCLLLGVGLPADAHASARADRGLGAALFHERGCEHCHGVDGVGTERGPDLSGVGRLLHKPDIEKQIRDGGKSMPAFGDSLSNDEVQQLVAYLAAKKKRGTKLTSWPGAISKNS
jgi:mono/diheme cytochrome c family protein